MKAKDVILLAVACFLLPALAIDWSLFASICERGSFAAWAAHVHDAVGICAFIVMVNVIFLGTFALICSEARKSWK